MDYWLEGYKACSNNKKHDTNPYVADLQSYGEWNKGWHKAEADIKSFKVKKNSMHRRAFNDMLSKGFDSAIQESFLFQKLESNPSEYEWVWDVYNKHGHAWDYDKHKRDNKGRYVSFPSGIGSNSSNSKGSEAKLKNLLTRFGSHLQRRGFIKEARLLRRILK